MSGDASLEACCGRQVMKNPKHVDEQDENLAARTLFVDYTQLNSIARMTFRLRPHLPLPLPLPLLGQAAARSLQGRTKHVIIFGKTRSRIGIANLMNNSLNRRMPTLTYYRGRRLSWGPV